MHGLDIFVARLAIEFSNAFARCGVVRHEAAVILVAIQFEHIDGLAVGTPGNVGEIDGFRVGDKITEHTAVECLERDGFVRVYVINTYCHHVGVHARHGIFVRLIGRFAWEDIHLRIVRHHALVHAVEGQSRAVRTPERAFADAKLITVDGLSVHNFATAVRRQLVFLAFGIDDIQLMVLDNRRGFPFALAIVVLVGGQGTDVLAGIPVNEETPFLVDAHQFVAPPCIKLILRLQGLIAFATEVQFFEGKEVFLLSARHKR